VDFGIGPSQILLLKAALSLDRSEAVDALDEWWNRIADFDDVRGTDSALFPQIYWNLGATIRNSQLAGRLKGAARHQWIRNQYLIASCGELLDLLIQSKIPMLLLKGAAIATVIDDDPGLRTMSDCDVLIPRSKAVEVLDRLLASKLTEPLKVSDADLDVVHGVTLFRRQTAMATVDLHWQPLRTIRADEFAVDMFESAKPVQFAGRACLACCPEHLVFHAIIHGTDWSPYPRYDWLVDTTKILRRAGTGFDWQKLVSLARRYGYSFLIGSALNEAYLRTGADVPAWVRRLGSRQAIIERREVRIRLLKPSSLSTSDELLIALQKLRRGSNLGRPVRRAVPTLVRSLFGTRSTSRIFIDDSRKERIILLHGWSAPEPTGRWTEGKFVSLAIRATETPRPAALKLKAFPIRSEAVPAQVIHVFAGLRRLGTLTWSKSGPDPYAQEIRLPDKLWRGDTLVVRFHVGMRVTPIEVGINGDTRALGVFVEELTVDPAVRDAADTPLDLSSAGSDLAALWHGWSWPEPHGCWTHGPVAVLRWRASRLVSANSSLLIEIAMVAPGCEELRGRFILNDHEMQPFRFETNVRDALVRIPVPTAIEAGQSVKLKVEIDNPRSPAQTVGANDLRPLGLSIRRVRIDPTIGQI
jgi:hypothetical protein